MAKTKTPKSASASQTGSKRPSTQRFLDIAEIRDDVVIMKDGTLRTVLLVSSINFALKSDDEQNAIIAAYVNFLNTIDFPLQIVIQSRKLDIDGYLKNLEEREREQTNELLRLQIAEYRQYVKELVDLGDIMTKKFYVAVPYNPLSDKQHSWFHRLVEVFRVASRVKVAQEKFIRRRKELFQRVEHVTGALNSIGLKAVPLDTQGLIELYYNTYNPGESRRQKLPDINALQLES